MDFYKESLQDIGGLSIHWSSDCNIACKYCYIEKEKHCMASYNRDIRQALADGSFVKIIKDKLGCIKDQIESISLWGAEPTINSQYFADFSREMLEFFPSVKFFMFSTNAKLGGKVLFEDFAQPLIDWAESNQRPVTFQLQLSLDGPPEYNDDSRYQGATQTTLEALKTICDHIPEDLQYFTLEVSTKATLDVSYMRKLVEGGQKEMQYYYQFMNDVGEACDEYAKNKRITNYCFSIPTLVDPGYHTVEDGKTLAAWIKLLQSVDRSTLNFMRGKPLFNQPLSGIQSILEADNILAQAPNFASCSSSKNNITIDHEGILYTCNRLCRNAATRVMDKGAMISNTNYKTTDKKWLKRTYGSRSYHEAIVGRAGFARAQIMTLASLGQIDKKYLYDEDAQKLLYYASLGLMCHIGVEEDYSQSPFIPALSYWRYLGNGALDALIEYYKLEVARGNMKVWKIVM